MTNNVFEVIIEHSDKIVPKLRKEYNDDGKIVKKHKTAVVVPGLCSNKIPSKGEKEIKKGYSKVKSVSFGKHACDTDGKRKQIVKEYFDKLCKVEDSVDVFAFSLGAADIIDTATTDRDAVKCVDKVALIDPFMDNLRKILDDTIGLKMKAYKEDYAEKTQKASGNFNKIEIVSLERKNGSLLDDANDLFDRKKTDEIMNRLKGKSRIEIEKDTGTHLDVYSPYVIEKAMKGL